MFQCCQKIAKGIRNVSLVLEPCNVGRLSQSGIEPWTSRTTDQGHNLMLKVMIQNVSGGPYLCKIVLILHHAQVM